MTWQTSALLAPALWAACAYLDKYLVTRYFKQGNTALLVMLSGFFACVIGFLMLLAGVPVASPTLLAKLVMLSNGTLFMLAWVPYYYALREEDTSIVIPIFQTIPVFGYILAFFFLGETLSSQQILAALIIIAGAIGLSLDLKEKMRLKSRPLLLMLLSSFLLAVVNLIFKKMAIQESYWVTNFWEYTGSGIVALVIFLVSSTSRTRFFNLFHSKTPALLFVATQESLNIAGNLLFNLALLGAPIALTSVLVNGLQPFYILIFGTVLTLLLPKSFNEGLTKKDIAQKIVFVCIIFLGSILLNR